MNPFKEKLLSEDYVETVVFGIVGKDIILIIGLIIGYYLKIWLF